MTVFNTDCLDGMRWFPDNTFDSIVTDPPYGIRFMGAAWDGADIEKRTADRRSQAHAVEKSGALGGYAAIAAEAGKYDRTPRGMLAFQEFSEEWSREAFRVLKPGGHLLSFSSARTYHRMVCGIEAAGFEIRDQIFWVFGSGFPKSHNLEGDWDGWGTALKPAHEPICVARKPLVGTVAANVTQFGTGAINIDACRVGDDAAGWGGGAAGGNTWTPANCGLSKPGNARPVVGRWPANLIHDGSDEVIAAFPQAAGQLADASTNSEARTTQNVYGSMRRGRGDEPSAESDNEGAGGFKMKPGTRRDDAGSAARFFYCAKASKADRDEGLKEFEPTTRSDGRTVAADNAYQRGKTPRANTHPTVKPTTLMRYLCRLVTPPGGSILDPFAGSGSTGKAATLEGFSFIGFELDAHYAAIANARIGAAK